jgi:hypothetical protein
MFLNGKSHTKIVGLKHTKSLSTLLLLGEKVPFKLDLIGPKKKKKKK